MRTLLDTSVSELAARPATTPVQTDAPTQAVTPDGRVIKNTAKIESINAQVDTRITASFYSWQVSREVRRDFNLLSAKIVTRAKSANAKDHIREMLVEMRQQAVLLQVEAQRFPIMQLASPDPVELRLVSPLAAQLYRAFNEADLSIARLTEVSKAGIIMQSNQESIVEPFFAVYKDLKGYLLGTAISSTKTAAQLGREIGVS